MSSTTPMLRARVLTLRHGVILNSKLESLVSKAPKPFVLSAFDFMA